MNIYYKEHSGLSKHDTLFLHGNLASHRWWKPTVDEWIKEGSAGEKSLFLSDWRGCGANEDWPQDKTFTLEDLALDQLSVLDRLNLHDVDLVGHSLGGLIALQMMILDPKRFRKAVLLDSVGARGVVFDESMYEAFKQMAASRDLTRAVILSTVLNGDVMERSLKEEIADDAFKAVRGIGTSVLEILKSVDLAEKAKGVAIPTLILHGAQDQIIPPDDSRALHDLMPESKLEILDSQGHCWNVENPKTFTHRLRSWLN